MTKRAWFVAQAVSLEAISEALVDDGYCSAWTSNIRSGPLAQPTNSYRRFEIRVQLVALKGGFDEVYQLADMGGMGFIHSAETQIMHNSMLVNVNMVEAAAQAAVDKYF